MACKLAGSVAACALVLLATGQPGLHADETASLQHLSGRWSGQGTVTPTSGPSESFRCVITYLMSESSAQVKQTLRCLGETYKFDAATRLEISGVRVTGVWTDNTYALAGTVSGKVTSTGFEIQLNGNFFQAKMTVVGSGCEQSVKVVPERAYYMKELTAELKKC